MEFSRVGVGWRLVLDVGQQESWEDRFLIRTPQQEQTLSTGTLLTSLQEPVFSNPPSHALIRTIHNDLQASIWENHAWIVSFYPFSSLPALRTQCCIQAPQKTLLQKTPLWSFHMNRAHKSVRSDEYMCINYLCFPQFKTKEYKGMWCGD